MAKAKENVLNVGIQIISSDSVQNYQEATIKEPLLEDHGVITPKMKKKRLKKKNVLWLKLLMSSKSLKKMLNLQKPSGDKSGLGFNFTNESTSECKQVNFVKSQEVESKEKVVELNSSPRPKFMLVNNTKIPIASEDKVKRFYKPSLKPRVGFTKPKTRSKTPYGMFLTRLFRHVIELYPHLENGIYDVVERVMRPLALRQTRRPRSDHGKARHSISSTFAHHNLGSSSHQGDDDGDDGASRASTLSPTTYPNSLNPLDYQNYHMPSSSEQTDETLFARQTTLNQMQ
ncbi:hypothetical protein Tco_1513021 [Tanacetum coccineum]